MFRTACIFVALALCAATAPPRISLDLAGSDAHTALHGDTHSAAELNSTHGISDHNDVDYSKAVEIMNSTATIGSDLPVAKAFDHVDQNVSVTTIITLVDLNGDLHDHTLTHVSGAITSTTHLNVAADLDVNDANDGCLEASQQRSTYVFTYDAVDDAGNNAEQLTFVLQLEDHTKPTVGSQCSDYTFEAGQKTLLEGACTDGLKETCTDNSMVDTNTASGCAKTLESTISSTIQSTQTVNPGTTLTSDDAWNYDTAHLTCADCKGLAQPVTFTCTDTAGIYGVNEVGNIADKTISLECIDTTPPTVVGGGTDSSEVFECKGGSGGANWTEAEDTCAGVIAPTPTFTDLAPSWDASVAILGDDNWDTNNVDIKTREPVSYPFNYPNTFTGTDDCFGLTTTVTRTYTVDDTTPPYFSFTRDAGTELVVLVQSHNDLDETENVTRGQTLNPEKSWAVITAEVDMLLNRTMYDCCSTPTLVSSKWFSCTSATTCGSTATGEDDTTHGTDDIPLSDTNTNTEYWEREYTIRDVKGNTYTKAHVVHIKDKEIPIITVQDCTSESYTGSGSDIHACVTKVDASLTGVYTDAGAKCSDFVDGSLSHAVEVSGDVVNLNTQTSKTFTIKYNCADLSGNAAAEATRTVDITDTTPPVIAAVGNYTYEAGYTYTDILPTVNDDMCVDTDLTCIIATSTTVATLPAVVTSDGDVNTLIPGTYTITYAAIDESNNEAEPVTRVVTIADTMAPVIVLSHPDTPDESAFTHTRGSTGGTTANSTTDHGTQLNAIDSTGRAVAASGETKIPKIVDQDGYSVATDSMWMPKDSFMAESTSVNGWFIGAIACAVTGVALLGLATRKVSTEVPV